MSYSVQNENFWFSLIYHIVISNVIQKRLKIPTIKEFFWILVHMMAINHCAKERLAWFDVVQIRAPKYPLITLKCSQALMIKQILDFFYQTTIWPLGNYSVLRNPSHRQHLGLSYVCCSGTPIQYHESKSTPWVLSIPWVHVFNMRPCQYHESMSIPRVLANYITIPWV